MKSLQGLLAVFLVLVPAVLAQKPRGFWFFNDKYGTPFKDMSDNGHPAVPYNVVLDQSTSTSELESVHFTGQKGSSVTVENLDKGLDVGSFTVLLHIDPDGVVESESVLLAFHGENDKSTQVYLTNDGKVQADVYDSQGSRVNSVAVKGIVFGSWNLVAVAFNHENGRLDIRLADNYKESNTDRFSGVYLSSGTTLWFGSDKSGSRAYEGHIACAALFGEYMDIRKVNWSVYDTQCFDAKITCDQIVCGYNQECRVVEGISQCLCLPGFIDVNGVCTGYGLCRTTGDPHGYSFDGKENSYQGACTYIWAQDGCKNGFPDEDQEPRFIVATKNWKRNGNRPVSWLKEVLVYVDDKVIVLKQDGIVFIDDEMVPGLPVQVNNDVRVFERPNYVYVQTKFGLQVMWDRTFSLRISVTDDYKNKVCGMCGNYDGNPDNDWIVGPNNKMCSFEFNNRTGGSKTKHEPTFGMSWMYGNDTSSECLNSCKPFPPGPACTEEEMQAANKSCKALLESDGPLEDCIEALGDVRVTDIVKDCIFDECSAKFNGSAIVCGDASLMADECSAEAGISLVWRGPDFCPLPCPDNAFYTTCMTECNPTCGDKYGKSCTPNGICQEGCQCKNGYLFANDECILETHCGCPDNTTGGIVPIGASVVHGDCEEMCECGSHGSKLNCTPMKCRADQDCSVINGVKQCACPPLHGDINGKCVPPASCRCSGDPHCYMFDGEHFSYQGSCLYTMVQDGCQNGLPNEAPNFQVLINNNRLMGKKLASRIYDVTVLFRKMNMTVVLHQGGMVSINGDETPLPYQAFNMTISDSPNGVDLISEYGIQVFWNRIYSLVINVAGGHFDGVCGMCGTYNNNKKDDMVMGPTDQCMPNTIGIAPGTLLKDEVIFGSSWFHSMDGDDKNCKTDCEGLPYPLKCENKQAKKLCSNLKKPKGPLGRCIDAMGKTAFKSAYRDCLFDTCTQGEVTDKYACVAAEQIMATCENQYGIKYKWRSNKFCPQPCPDHATYLECGQKCTPNCDDPEGLRCSKLIGSNCVAGCFCDKGYIYFDGFCRPKAECKVLRRPCSNLVHPGGDGKYDARVQCLTCKDQPSDAKCRETGTWETCMAYNAICDRTIVTSSNGAVSLSRGCKARADCPERSIGEDLCTTKKGQQTCYQCNYGTLREFQQSIKHYRCQEWVNRDDCILDKDAGSKVKGLRGKRYYFSTSKCKCMAFTYNGAGGNDNNFASAGECGEACSSWRLPDRCLLPADKGTGKSPVKMFYYNAKKNRCKKFQFKGEGGNGNRYSNKKECMQTCMQCGEA